MVSRLVQKALPDIDIIAGGGLLLPGEHPDMVVADRICRECIVCILRSAAARTRSVALGGFVSLTPLMLLPGPGKQLRKPRA